MCTSLLTDCLSVLLCVYDPPFACLFGHFHYFSWTCRVLTSLAAFNFLTCTVWTSKSLSQTTYLATEWTSSVVTLGAKIYFLNKMEGINTADRFWMNCLFRSESDTWPQICISNIISRHTVVTGHPCGRLQLLHNGKIWFILEFLEDIYFMSNKFFFLLKALWAVGFLWEYLSEFLIISEKIQSVYFFPNWWKIYLTLHYVFSIWETSYSYNYMRYLFSFKLQHEKLIKLDSRCVFAVFNIK